MRHIFERIGQRLKKMREAKEISQSELAAHLDFDKRTIVRIEKGQPSTTLTIEKIAQALNIDGETLVTASETKFIEIVNKVKNKKVK